MAEGPDYTPLYGNTSGVWRTKSGDDIVAVFLQWAKTFPEGTDAKSRRIEMQGFEKGDAPHWSYQECGYSNYFKFAQVQGCRDALRPVTAYIEMVGGELPLFMSRLHPLGASDRLREAWWTVARPVLNGKPVLPGRQVLAACEQRDGGQNAYGELVALSWTATECQVIVCYVDHVECKFVIQLRGGLPEDWIARALAGAVVEWAMACKPTFGDLVQELKACVLEAGNGNGAHLPPESWEERWEVDRADMPDADAIEAYFVDSDSELTEPSPSYCSLS